MVKLIYWTDGVWINPDYIISLERRGSKLVLDGSDMNSGRILKCPSEELAKATMDRILNDINKTMELDELKKEIETLRAEIHYRPDGPGYNEAKNHFTNIQN